MLTGALIVWFAEATISAAIVAADVGHTPESPVLKWGSWFIYRVALTAGFAISDPLDWWLDSARLNDGMMTVRPGARPGPWPEGSLSPAWHWRRRPPPTPVRRATPRWTCPHHDTGTGRRGSPRTNTTPATSEPEVPGRRETSRRPWRPWWP